MAAHARTAHALTAILGAGSGIQARLAHLLARDGHPLLIDTITTPSIGRDMP